MTSQPSPGTHAAFTPLKRYCDCLADDDGAIADGYAEVALILPPIAEAANATKLKPTRV